MSFFKCLPEEASASDLPGSLLMKQSLILCIRAEKNEKDSGRLVSKAAPRIMDHASYSLDHTFLSWSPSKNQKPHSHIRKICGKR